MFCLQNVAFITAQLFYSFYSGFTYKMWLSSKHSCSIHFVLLTECGFHHSTVVLSILFYLQNVAFITAQLFYPFYSTYRMWLSSQHRMWLSQHSCFIHFVLLTECGFYHSTVVLSILLYLQNVAFITAQLFCSFYTYRMWLSSQHRMWLSQHSYSIHFILLTECGSHHSTVVLSILFYLQNVAFITALLFYPFYSTYRMWLSSQHCCSIHFILLTECGFHQSTVVLFILFYSQNVAFITAQLFYSFYSGYRMWLSSQHCCSIHFILLTECGFHHSTVVLFILFYLQNVAFITAQLFYSFYSAFSQQVGGYML